MLECSFFAALMSCLIRLPRLAVLSDQVAAKFDEIGIGLNRFILLTGPQSLQDSFYIRKIPAVSVKTHHDF